MDRTQPFPERWCHISPRFILEMAAGCKRYLSPISDRGWAKLIPRNSRTLADVGYSDQRRVSGGGHRALLSALGD